MRSRRLSSLFLIQIDLIGIRITATKFNRAGDTPSDPIALADLPGFRAGHI